MGGFDLRRLGKEVVIQLDHVMIHPVNLRYYFVGRESFPRITDNNAMDRSEFGRRLGL